MAIQSEPVHSPAIITYCNETHTMEFYVPYNTLCATFEKVLRNSILQRIYTRPHNKQHCFPFQSPMAANFPIITTTTTNAVVATDNSFDQFFHILRSQHKHTIIISSLLILFFISILIFSLRKLFQIIQRTISTESLYNGKDTIWTLSDRIVQPEIIHPSEQYNEYAEIKRIPQQHTNNTFEEIE